MKAITTYIIAAVIMLLISLSCEREARNVRLPEFDQKLVITSFISPRDSASFVKVSSNERIYGDLTIAEGYGNLTVTMSDGQKRINLEPSGDVYLFRRKDLAVSHGKKYFLEVSSDKGFNAEAVCTVPQNRDLGISVDTVTTWYEFPGGDRFSERKMNVYLNDPPGEDNYYSFSVKVLDYNPYFGTYPYIYETYTTDDIYFSDEGNDGKRIFANAVYTSGLPADSDSTLFIFYILNTDKDYYSWHKSLNKFSGGDDPFREISPAYSNITGGLGIFASYTVDSIVYKLR